MIFQRCSTNWLCSRKWNLFYWFDVISVCSVINSVQELLFLRYVWQQNAGDESIKRTSISSNCGITGCCFPGQWVMHYNDVIMSTVASQITSLQIVYSSFYSDADQRKHQSCASLAFVRGFHQWPVNSPQKGPVTRKMFPFDDASMDTQHPLLGLISWYPVKFLQLNWNPRISNLQDTSCFRGGAWTEMRSVKKRVWRSEDAQFITNVVSWRCDHSQGPDSI